MAPGHVCHVLAVLGDGEASMWRTYGAAVELAEAAHARLTLAKTCEDGRAYVWAAPFAVGGAYLPPPYESPEEAAQLLAQVATHVPATIPVTTVVLGADTQSSLLELLGSGRYGALVLDADLLAHCRRLRRQLRREPLRTLAISSDSQRPGRGRIPGHFSSSEVTEDGAVDADQVSEGPGRRKSGLRPRHAGRRLAGAGGK